MAVKKSKAFKTAVKAASVAVAVLLAAVTALTVYIMVCNMRGEVADVFGVSVVRVITGSMEPSIHVGDYIILKKTDASELDVGDVICFYSADSAIYGKPNTHRIVRVREDGSFITKGDASMFEDSAAVAYDSIIGRYEGKAGFLRWINSFASVKKLLLIAVIVIMTAAAIYEVRSIARITAQSRSRCKSSEQQKLIRQAIDKEKQKLYEQGADISEIKSEKREAEDE